MRIVIFIMISLFISSNSYSAEIIDCSKETNFLKKLDCKQKSWSKNLKSKLNKKQAETKEKIKETAKDLKSKVESN